MSASENGPGIAKNRHQEFLAKIEPLKSSGQLPSPKGVALAIMEICRKEDISTDAIARLVQADPALSARLLRLANSAASNISGRPVASIPDAITRLGLSTVKQVAMGFSIVDQYREGPCSTFDYTRYWSHSLLMAVAMQTLGAIGRLGSPDELFVCGLMARIGCLSLATAYPTQYAELLEKHTNDEQLAALERQHMQADHNDFTAAIMTDCGIPSTLVEPVFYHENPGASGFIEGTRPYQLVHLIYHAKRLADMGVGSEVERSGIISELMLMGSKLGLDAVGLGSLVDRIIAQWHEWGELLKVPSNILPTFAAMATAPAPKVEEQHAMYPPMRVLLVEDDPTSRTMISGVLSSIIGRKVHTAQNGHEALSVALDVMPQIIITDWQMPVMDGLEFCRALRATEWGQSIYVIMLTGVDEDEDIVVAFEAGVDDYVNKPVNIRALRARMRAALHYVHLLDAWEKDREQLKQFAAALAISNRKLQHIALTDLLTGLPNRRAGLDALSQVWSSANRSGQPMSVLMMDIDRFKSVNDTHGHAVGDKVLSEVGKLIRELARNEDQVCRLGGEEFLMVCQNTDLNSALKAAERLRKAVNAKTIKAEGITIQTSISIGVASKEPIMSDAHELMSASDKALYTAKHGGRNRTCLYSSGTVHEGTP